MATARRTSTEVATRTPTQELVSQVRSEQFLEQVRLALPTHIRPERFVRAVVTAVQQNPEVVVHPDTLFRSAIQCAQDGLMPDGREAAFVVVKDKGEKKIAYWPMIGGYRKIAANHGYILVADVVHANDRFEWSKLPPRIEHEPALGDRGEIVCAYAAGFDRDWRFVTAPAVMDVPEIEKVRKVSKAAQSEYGPWVNWWERMAVKTVGRRAFKELPLRDLEEAEARIVAAADDEADFEHPTVTVDEANIAAGLTGRPVADDGPDDSKPTTPASAVQAAELLQLVVQLSEMDGETDWQQHAADYAQAQFERPLNQLAAGELDQVLDQLRELLPKVEA